MKERRIAQIAQSNRTAPRDSVDALMASWMEGHPDLDLEPLGVIARLERVRTHIDQELGALFTEHGLSPASFSALVTLVRLGGDRGVSQRALMDELGLTSGTVSVRVDRLIEAGLVERRPDPEQKRNVLVSLTAKGRDLVERVIPAHLANERRLLASLSEDERTLLSGLLRKMLVEFEGSLPPVGSPRLGLTVSPAHTARAMRAAVGLPPATGLLVRAVEEGGAGAAAGIEPGDVLLRARGIALRSAADLYAAIAADSGPIRIRLVRGSDERWVSVRLGGGGRPAGGPAATAGRTARGDHVI
jgi:DNA-binding MarR family transcriptional regulator